MKLILSGGVKAKIKSNKIESSSGFLVERTEDYIKLYSPSTIVVNGNQIHNGCGDNIIGNNIINYNGSITINGSYNGICVTGSGNVINQTITDNNVITSSTTSSDEDLIYEIMIKLSDVEDIEMQGQCQLDILDETNVEDIDLSGQSKITLSSNEDVVNIDLSGQSSVGLTNSNIEKLMIDCSGMSKVSLTNNTINKLRANLSGMSKLNGMNNIINKEKINTSGMAKSYL